MPRIERITLREILLPLVEPFRTASGVVVARRVLLLAFVDSDGIDAWTECVAESSPTYSTETVDTSWIAITQWLAPRIVGQSFATPEAVQQILDAGLPGHRMAKAALEMGVWSLEAERRALPLARLLVDASEVARELAATPREYIETGIALGMQADPDSLVKRAREALAEGYRRIKMKIEPGRDVEYIRAVRENLGRGVALTADANRSYAELNDPVAALQALDVFDLAMIEQPLGRDDLAGHAELQHHISTPICLDESVTGIPATKDMLALGSAKILNLKPGRVGGFSVAVGIHDICARARLPVWCGGMLETGIGRACNVALASLPNFTLPGDLSPSARYWERDIVSPAWTMDSSGRVRVPLERPGLGVDVDVGRIDDLTERIASLSA